MTMDLAVFNQGILGVGGGGLDDHKIYFLISKSLGFWEKKQDELFPIDFLKIILTFIDYQVLYTHYQICWKKYL